MDRKNNVFQITMNTSTNEKLQIGEALPEHIRLNLCKWTGIPQDRTKKLCKDWFIDEGLKLNSSPKFHLKYNTKRLKTCPICLVIGKGRYISLIFSMGNNLPMVHTHFWFSVSAIHRHLQNGNLVCKIHQVH